jgi:hypothetical protein
MTTPPSPNPLSRRRFVGAATVAGATAVLGRTPAGAAVRAAAGAPPLTRSTFAPLVGATFALTDSRGTADVVLTGIDDLAGSAAADGDGCFSLAFDGRPNRGVAQGVYALSRGRVRHSVLVVPVDRGVARPRYQVVVNRAVPV